jgi:hypothetical protein
LALQRWDSPPGQHRLEGHILEWVRRRLRESPARAREAFDALPLPHRRVFAARRLEAGVEEAGFEGFFAGPYAELAPDALEALKAFGAHEHARVVEEALAARGAWLSGRRKRRLAGATLAFLRLEETSAAMALRAGYIDREGASFADLA